MREVCFDPTPDGWLAAALEQLSGGRKPSDILWTETTAEQPALPGLFADGQGHATPDPPAFRSTRPPFVPKDFRSILKNVAHHRDRTKWPLLYSILWRLTSTEPSLLAIEVDDEQLACLRCSGRSTEMPIA